MLGLTKPTWKINDAVELCSFYLRHNHFGMVKANVRRLSDKNYTYRSELLNSTDKLLGFDEFSLVSKDVGTMFDLKIAADESLRKKDFRIGELLRLVSIMQLLKNRMKRIDLYSVADAVYFHSKYKFAPNITKFDERNNLLETVVKDKSSGFEILQGQAEIILDKAKNIEDAAQQRELCKYANSIGWEYIQKVLKKGHEEYKKHPFERGMDMILTKSEITMNKEFFDDKFKANGIDFEI